uniref:Gustatory receptor n=1 Tax=Bombyx mori TaxID=7091 RepID=B7FF41_BOMMO|nr:TPA_inf: gustatory receptor 51 [Bombyx mori]
MAMGIRTILSKVKPLELPDVSENNFADDGLKIVQRFKFFIYIQVLTGINRLYLLKCNKFVMLFSYLYAIFLISFVASVYWTKEPMKNSHLVIRLFSFIEYILLICISVFLKKKKMMKFFENLSMFDQILKIDKNVNSTFCMKRVFFWVTGSIVYNLIEFYALEFYDNTSKGLMTIICTYTIALTHDCEQIFFFTLQRVVYLRLLVVKRHIQEHFKVDEDSNRKKPNKYEMLSKNVQLNLTALHEVYGLLHNCAEKLNKIMSIPVLLMLFTSGLTTTILLRILVRVIQLADPSNPGSAIGLCVYLIVRCIKYTLLVVISCYYSSITATQVSLIRITINDAINTIAFGKLQRRKVKAFYLMTKEYSFVYTLAGVIKLNMSLPLSYISLCTTYLVIIIQFSKFFD